jgi:peroxiredoxin
LLDFQKNMKEFEKRNIQVIAASADTWDLALGTVERYKLTFRIGYGLNPREVSELTGAFYNEREKYLHATGFVIGPDGRIEDAVYSSRSIGRLVAKDCLEFIGG